jgi:hypothetical protein
MDRTELLLAISFTLIMLAACSHGGVNAAAAQSPTKLLYKDFNQPVALRVKDLMSRMTLAEKIGQMTQIERSVANASDIEHYLVGDYHPEHSSFPSKFTLGSRIFSPTPLNPTKESSHDPHMKAAELLTDSLMDLFTTVFFLH